MLVREAMTTGVVTVGPATTLRAAAELLTHHRITAMPVVDDGLLVGIISEADVVHDALAPDQRRHMLRVPARQGPAATRVGEVMTATPVAISPEADLAQAVEIMAAHGYKSLPVTEHGRVVGVISRADVVGELTRHDDQVARDVLALLRAEGLDWTVAVSDGIVVIGLPEGEQARALAQALVMSVRGVRGLQFGSFDS